MTEKLTDALKAVQPILGRTIESAVPLIVTGVFVSAGLHAQDVLVSGAATASTTMQTIAGSLGMVILVVGLIIAGFTRRIEVAFLSAFLGAALAVAPRLLTTFQGYFN